MRLRNPFTCNQRADADTYGLRDGNKWIDLIDIVIVSFPSPPPFSLSFLPLFLPHPSEVKIVMLTINAELETSCDVFAGEAIMNYRKGLI